MEGICPISVTSSTPGEEEEETKRLGRASTPWDPLSRASSLQLYVALRSLKTGLVPAPAHCSVRHPGYYIMYYYVQPLTRQKDSRLGVRTFRKDGSGPRVLLAMIHAVAR